MTGSGPTDKVEYCPRCNGQTPHRVRRRRWHVLLMGLGPVIALLAPLPWFDTTVPQDHLTHMEPRVVILAGLVLPSLMIATVMLRVRQWRLVCIVCGKSWRLDAGVGAAAADWDLTAWKRALWGWAFAQAMMLAGAMGTYVHAARAYAWKATEGVIHESQRDVTQRDFPSLGMERVQRVRFGYTYTINGELFNGNRIDPDKPIAKGTMDESTAFDKAVIDTHLARYAPGQKVTVWYNPAKPRESALELGEARTWALIWAMGAAGWLFVMMMVVRVRRPEPAKASSDRW